MDSLYKTSNSLQSGSEDISRDKEKSVDKRFLANKLNSINFQNRTILINLKHIKYGDTISLQAKPLPCNGECLDCLWAEAPGLDRLLKIYVFDNLLITDGNKLLVVKPEVISINEKGISLILPGTCSEITSRGIKRETCTGIIVQLIQNGALFHGALLDFNPVSLRVEMSSASPKSFPWLNLESPVNLLLFAGLEVIYSAECTITRQDCNHATRTLVLEPVSSWIQRFKPKQYRSIRQTLVPSPNIVFNHPFTGRTVNLRAVDLSGTGFSVEEDENKSLLLPGMIVQKLHLGFAQSFRITCKAQVIYRNSSNEKAGIVKCGLAILDMQIDDHLKLLALLHEATNRNSYICTDVDMRALWDFFFETGFIYPKKYVLFQANNMEMKNTYERLYVQNPHIARHFIYQNNGVILGHMAMMRFYKKSWLIHHHASSRSQSMKAGMTVLNQIGRFINDSHNLYSAHMDFVFCYFRPDNKFPNRIFGGMARNLQDPKGCSLDTFAYFHFQRSVTALIEMPIMWELTESNAEDLMELKSFYDHKSNGLMLCAFDLEPGEVEQDELTQEYRNLGFKKERHLFSLKKNGSLIAVAMANISDIGLNMSNLTCSTKVIVLDDDLPRDIFTMLLSFVSTKYDEGGMSVLLYPLPYAEKCSIPFEKLYDLWILNMRYTDHYFDYMKNLIHPV